jgi:hypothetical protein
MGATRNAILLRTAGALLYSVDDDTFCRACRAPGSGASGLAVREGRSVDEFWFYPDREACLRGGESLSLDIFAEHERFLGRRVGEPVDAALAEGSGTIDLHECCAHFLLDLHRDTGRICLTANGIVGDSGLYSGMGILTHPGSATRERLCQSEQTLRQALSSRNVLSHAPVASIVHGGSVMSMFLGIDNRELTLPFLPLYRNEDGVFGFSVQQCLPDCYLAHLPWALAHDPPEIRTYTPECWSTVRVSDAVMTCMALRSAESGTVSADCRQRLVALALSAMASGSHRDFVAELRNGLWQRAARILQQHAELIERHGERPEFWARALSTEMARLRRAVDSPDYPIPVELKHYGPGNALHVLQRLIGDFGELLWWWPEIVERAKALNLQAPDSLPRG